MYRMGESRQVGKSNRPTRPVFIENFEIRSTVLERMMLAAQAESIVAFSIKKNKVDLFDQQDLEILKVTMPFIVVKKEKANIIVIVGNY